MCIRIWWVYVRYNDVVGKKIYDSIVLCMWFIVYESNFHILLYILMRYVMICGIRTSVRLQIIIIFVFRYTYVGNGKNTRGNFIEWRRGRRYFKSVGWSIRGYVCHARNFADETRTTFDKKITFLNERETILRGKFRTKKVLAARKKIKVVREILVLIH